MLGFITGQDALPPPGHDKKGGEAITKLHNAAHGNVHAHNENKLVKQRTWRYDMFKKLTSKVLVVFMTAVMVNLMVGCNDSLLTMTDSPAETDPQSDETMLTVPAKTGDNKIADEVDFDGGTVIAATMNCNDEASSRIHQVSNFSVIQGQFTKLEELGFEYAPQYSYIMEGDAVPDSCPSDTFSVEIVVLAMVYIPDIMERVVYINYANVPELGSFVQSSIMSFVPESPESGYERVDPDIDLWILSYPAIYGARVTESMAASWSWGSWLECTAKGTIAGCAGAAGGCLLAGPGYGHCVAVGCTGTAVASAVGCALHQLW